MWKEFLAHRPNVALVASDMDGTLLNERSELPDGFWPLLRKLQEQGVLFVPASGRGYGSLARLFPSDELGFIAENGNLVMLRGEEVFSAALEPGVVSEAVGTLRGVGGRDFGTVACGKHVAYTERGDDAFLEEAGKYYTTLHVVPDVLEIEEDFMKLAVFDFDSSAPIFDELDYLNLKSQVVRSGPNWVDVMSAGVDKGTALRELQQRIGVAPDETMVFGDFHNDLPLFENAEHTFAVANGHSDVREAAKYQVPANSEGGVLQVLAALFDA